MNRIGRLGFWPNTSITHVLLHITLHLLICIDDLIMWDGERLPYIILTKIFCHYLNIRMQYPQKHSVVRIRL